jgi:DNA-binding MarR family transcriptional regulator
METPGAEQISRSFTARWKHERLFDRGFVVLPTHFLESYSLLNPPITSGEALLVIHLMNFKWTDKAPFPGYSRLAKRMGVTDKAVRRHAASLEAKKYLQRIQRIGSTNQFDLTPLFDALLTIEKSKEEEVDA